MGYAFCTKIRIFRTMLLRCWLFGTGLLFICVSFNISSLTSSDAISSYAIKIPSFTVMI